jgi:tetratricopeptide (TPR) repeat protein
VPGERIMKASNAFNRPVAALIAGAILLGSGWLWWLCRHDNSIPFLPGGRAAEWVVYPKPPDAHPHSAMQLWAVFRRPFTLAAVPARANLSVRVFRQGGVRINGREVADLVLRERDWKGAHTTDVARFLQAGTNDISVTVSNSLGPPALWLSLKGDALALSSDPEWQVSLLGAAEQKAVLASEPPVIRRGNQLYGRELLIGSLGRAWPGLLLILLVSALAVGGSDRFLRSKSTAGPGGAAQAEGFDYLTAAPWAVLAGIILLWIVLLGNNLPQIAPLFGFDRDGHQEYIDYILKHKALPLADEGWQMYQPPLFYVVSALIVGPFGWTASTDAAVLLLRVCSALTGIAHLVLILLCLRLMFPNQPRRQVIGLIIAGFLPANLCLSHHLTNEGLAALFVTAALYFTLRLLQAQRFSPRLAIAVGTCLGLALLTKFSALLAIPFIVVAVAWQRKAVISLRDALFSSGLVLASLLAVCGWHFARVWHRFGTPLIGNWDPRLPFAWWQDPGCHTGAWYWRVGEALICPLFSSLTSFTDGVYATLWGDGLCSGSAMMDFRPQWNYDLMNAGYLLSILTTVLLVAGVIVALVRFMRQPSPEWFLMLGMVFGFAAGIALMTLRVASYAQVKAFYALPALFPLCAVAVTGWDVLEKKIGKLRPLLGVGLVAWAITLCCAFWIRSGNPFTYTVRGVNLADDKRYAEAAEDFSRAIQLDTNSLAGRVGLAEAWRQMGRGQEARQQAELALQQHPGEAAAHTEMAVMLSVDGHYAEAVRHLLQAVTEAPDHLMAYQQLAACLTQMGQHKQVIEVCEQGLRVDPFRPEVHQMLGVAAAAIGDLTNAVIHLSLALDLKPEWPETRGVLALALASLGELDQATGHYQRAIREKPDDAKLHYLFAVTLAMQGNGREAAEQYREVLKLQPDNAEALNNLAWILASNPSNDVRNGADAIRLAERACELSQHRAPILLGTLAAAYAEAGRFSDAVSAAEKARDLAEAAGDKAVAAKNRELLELYRAGKPYREPAPVNR